MLHERIKSLRIARGLNQVQLGNALGVTKQCVSNWENDNIQPSVEMLVRLAEYFSVSSDYLLGIESERTISADGLTESQMNHIRLIIDDIRQNRTGAERGTSLPS